jgi:hypothetical protein
MVNTEALEDAVDSTVPIHTKVIAYWTSEGLLDTS